MKVPSNIIQMPAGRQPPKVDPTYLAMASALMFAEAKPPVQLEKKPA